ncbi:ChbG/HpnK family deacetylase [Azotosporobacter soli]|uniref:ChbG/HpnK family deacetylase n=1 Tax=Azotosporobacter soli TaxID=3055040 RepID=UPI0031FF2407
MRRLIINADDFGLHEKVNQAIRIGHQKGIITSTTIMAGAPAFDDAVLVAKELPQLGVGVHLTLVGEQPVAAAESVRSLLDETGSFPRQYPQFLQRYLQGRISRAEIMLELAAQIEKVAGSGICITHLDSHQHLHVFPGILEIVLNLAERYAIPALRIPAEPYFFSGGYPYTLGRWGGRCALTFLAERARRLATQRGLRTTDSFFGMLAGGNMTETSLQRIISALPSGCSEIMMHPGCDNKILQAAFGWPYSWESELAAVCSSDIRSLIEKEQICLQSF